MSRSLNPRGAAFASWPGLDRAARATSAGQRVRGSRTNAEFCFTDADFDAVRALIRGRAGIALAPAKRNLVYGRLSRRVRALGVASFAEYLAQLTAPGSREWDAFTNALTTNLTSFYRESHHFPMLIEHLRHSAAPRPLTIWCSAASTGEEPYSIAIAACEAFASLTAPISIIASDIASDVLAVASRGIYLDERLAPPDGAQRSRYFEQAATLPSGHSRVRAELRRLIEFRRLNLIEANLAHSGRSRGDLLSQRTYLLRASNAVGRARPDGCAPRERRAAVRRPRGERHIGLRGLASARQDRVREGRRTVERTLA